MDRWGGWFISSPTWTGGGPHRRHGCRGKMSRRRAACCWTWELTWPTSRWRCSGIQRRWMPISSASATARERMTASRCGSAIRAWRSLCRQTLFLRWSGTATTCAAPREIIGSAELIRRRRLSAELPAWAMVRGDKSILRIGERFASMWRAAWLLVLSNLFLVTTGFTTRLFAMRCWGRGRHRFLHWQLGGGRGCWRGVRGVGGGERGGGGESGRDGGGGAGWWGGVAGKRVNFF